MRPDETFGAQPCQQHQQPRRPHASSTGIQVLAVPRLENADLFSRASARSSVRHCTPKIRIPHMFHARRRVERPREH
jgi:hypothetical protein